MTKTGLVLAWILAAVSAAGGVLGYTQAGSTASLAAGVAAGVLLAAGALGAARGMLAGRLVVIGVALLLLGRFLPAYFQAPRLWPSLVLIALSTGTFGFSLIGVVLDRYRPDAQHGPPSRHR